MASLRTTSVILAAAGVMALAGCGGDDKKDEGDELGGGSASLQPPETPKPEDCAGDALKTGERADNLAPKPGTYTYDQKGTRSESGSGSGTALPKTAELRVTPTIKVGNLVCFRSQTAYSPKEADTTTFVIRGGDVYVTSLDSFVAGQTAQFRPNPPIRGVDGSGAEQWTGSFGGPTQGTYEGTLLPRQSFSFEGKSTKSPGVKLHFAFKGELSGESTQETYVSLDDGTLFRQKVDQTRNLGASSVKLKYDWKLKSFSGD
ncbi:MAG TPA: hypothetical protein VF517_07120 [Thermoleophilaceae bacterium]|jgi:hypothetical protein